MHFIPFVRGKVKLDMTRVQFVERLVELTEGDYQIALPIDKEFYKGQKVKEFSREVYDNSFRLWKTTGTSREWMFYTTTYVRLLDEADNTISIRYFIRYNLWVNLVGLFMLGSTIYCSFMDAVAWGYFLFLYVIVQLTFNSETSDIKEFLRILTRQTDIGN